MLYSIAFATFLKEEENAVINFFPSTSLPYPRLNQATNTTGISNYVSNHLTMTPKLHFLAPLRMTLKKGLISCLN